jgi:hypothetical protein
MLHVISYDQHTTGAETHCFYKGGTTKKNQVKSENF